MHSLALKYGAMTIDMVKIEKIIHCFGTSTIDNYYNIL